jgi:hypothetical protein
LPLLPHVRAFAIAVRLLAGETLELDDEHGRHWRATASALSWVLAGETAPVVEGCAGDVALEIVSRGLVELEHRPRASRRAQ